VAGQASRNSRSATASSSVGRCARRVPRIEYGIERGDAGTRVAFGHNIAQTRHAHAMAQRMGRERLRKGDDGGIGFKLLRGPGETPLPSDKRVSGDAGADAFAFKPWLLSCRRRTWRPLRRHKESLGNSQSTPLIRLQRNFLREHNITRH
jgi:hypothetical protein